MLFLGLHPPLKLLPHIVFLRADAQNQLLVFLILIQQPVAQLKQLLKQLYSFTKIPRCVNCLSELAYTVWKGFSFNKGPKMMTGEQAP